MASTLLETDRLDLVLATVSLTTSGILSLSHIDLWSLGLLLRKMELVIIYLSLCMGFDAVRHGDQDPGL